MVIPKLGRGLGLQNLSVCFNLYRSGLLILNFQASSIEKIVVEIPEGRRHSARYLPGRLRMSRERLNIAAPIGLTGLLF